MDYNEKVTINDVAKRANVSITTVSLVLNNKAKSISKKTIEKVKKAAHEINYFADPIAASMITKKTKTIGYILPNIENMFFARIVKMMDIELSNYGYNLIICNSDESYERGQSAIISLTRRNVDFLVITPSSESLKKENLSSVTSLANSLKTPFLFVDREIDGINANVIVSDNEKGGYIATKHLIENGHSNIAYLSGPQEVSSSYHRYHGYLKALKESNISFSEDMLFIGDYSYETGYRAGLDIIKSKKITAVFAANDLMAYGLIKACHEKGVKIPQDLSIVGYDDLFYSSILDVPLTSVNHNINLMAKRVAEYVVEALKNKNKNDYGYDKILIKPHLVVRDSVKKIK